MSKPLRTRKKEEQLEKTSPSLVRRGWSVMRYLVTSELAHRFRQVPPQPPPFTPNPKTVSRD
jgi:hypothetical protein